MDPGAGGTVHRGGLQRWLGKWPTHTKRELVLLACAYYVQSPSHDDGENKTATSSFHSSPTASSPCSLGRNSRDRSSSRFSASKVASSRRGVPVAGGEPGGLRGNDGSLSSMGSSSIRPHLRCWTGGPKDVDIFSVNVADEHARPGVEVVTSSSRSPS